ncbi:MAG: hypothetical protein KKB50_18420 [Planctomycetes bacterium]|nr:hypothetical protein [Planctomycetota bacterium]
MIGTLCCLLIALALPGPRETVFDSGDPVPRNGEVAFVNFWQVLDPADNLCVRVIAPIGELTHPTRVTGFAFYAFNPKDPCNKRVEIYRGTDATSPGTLWKTIEFANHLDVRQGWAQFRLPRPILLPPGSYGIAFHAECEFHSYWAPNAPHGSDYAWVRPNDSIDWFKGDEDEFGFVPNFAVRVYGRNLQQGTGGAQALAAGGAEQMAPGQSLAPPGSEGGDDQPGSKGNLDSTASREAAPDTDAAGDPHRYEPGRREKLLRVIWRPDRTLSPSGAGQRN